MVINIEKSRMDYNNLSDELLTSVREMVPYPTTPIEEGFKYLGFFLKQNAYAYQDWLCLYKKVETIISNVGKPLSIYRRYTNPAQSSSTKNTNILGINNIYSKRNTEKNKEKMIVLPFNH